MASPRGFPQEETITCHTSPMVCGSEQVREFMSYGKSVMKVRTPGSYSSQALCSSDLSISRQNAVKSQQCVMGGMRALNILSPLLQLKART